MDQLPLTLFDLIVLVVVAFSALLAFARGAVRGILGLASWIGAAVVAFLLVDAVRPMVRAAVASDTIADALSVAGAFLIALIGLKLLAGMIARAVDASPLGPLDKLLGLGFGLLRGAVIVCLAYLLASGVMAPERQPDWVRHAYLIEPVRSGARLLVDSVPESWRREGLAAAGTAIGTAKEAARATQDAGQPSGGQGYSAEQRQAVDRLLAPQR